MIKRLGKIVFYFIAFWLIIGFILEPMLNTFAKSLGSEGRLLSNYVDYFRLPNNKEVFTNTLKIGIATTLVCGFIGTSLAIYFAFVKVKMRKIIHILLLSPMMVPGVIIVIAFIQLYGESGLATKGIQLLLSLNNIPFKFSGFWGILFIHAYTQYVYFYLNVSISLRYIDYSTIEVASGMGASKFKILTSIILPFIRPALISSAIVTFISGISSFSGPNLLGGYKVMSTQIMLSKANNRMDLASMQVVLLMIMGLSVLFLLRYFERKYSQESGIRANKIVEQDIGNKAIRLFMNMFIFSIVTLIVLPIITIFVLSFASSSSMMIDIFPKDYGMDNYLKIFNKKRVLKPFLNSINMSFQTVVVSLLISLPVAYLSTKKRNKINGLMEALIILPWAMPVSTIAVNLINSFNKRNIFVFNEILIGGYWILPIAYIIMVLPTLLRSNILAMENFNTDLEQASRSLGASKVKSFLTITTPMVSPAIISGASLVFIKTIGEYTMSALLYGVHNRPLSLAMVTAMQEFDIGLSMAYGSLGIMICFVAMLMVLKMEKEKYL